VLKGNFTPPARRGPCASADVLQFVISTFLIVATLIVQSQLDFIQTKKLGYDKDQWWYCRSIRKLRRHFLLQE
jgi:putative ABC transport system permease protein